MLRDHCDDACNSVLIENNIVTPDWVYNPFSSDSTVFNENRIASVITAMSAALMLTLGVNGPLMVRFHLHDVKEPVFIKRTLNLGDTYWMQGEGAIVRVGILHRLHVCCWFQTNVRQTLVTRECATTGSTASRANVVKGECLRVHLHQPLASMLRLGLRFCFD